MNIAEILKYCPEGTKLYSLVNGEVTLVNVESTNRYPIRVFTNSGGTEYFTKDGLLDINYPNGKCILFPSIDQMNWSKFRIPVKKGDIMMQIDGTLPFIASGESTIDNYPKYICGITDCGDFKISNNNNSWTDEFYIPASEEAKKELFNKIKEAGYRWNADTLELEKIESQFKKGDVVVDKYGNLCLVSKVESPITIVTMAVLYTDGDLKIYNNIGVYRLSKGAYRLSKEITLASIEARNKFYSTLVKEGYIYDKEQHKPVRQEFKPFDKVLVKNNSENPWKTDIYLNCAENTHYLYRCTTGHYKLCIPYEGNEYLLVENN